MHYENPREEIWCSMDVHTIEDSNKLHILSESLCVALLCVALLCVALRCFGGGSELLSLLCVREVVFVCACVSVSVCVFHSFVLTFLTEHKYN